MSTRLSMLLSIFGCALLIGCGDATDSKPVTSPDSPVESLGEQQPTEVSSETDGLFGPGSPAPPIAIAKWMQGEPVEEFEQGKVYVVEFWATWCGPCLLSMPHMAELQTEYGDKVAFIGVTNEDEETIAQFLASPSRSEKTWAEVLTYRIALDDGDGTNTAYMAAAKQNGIPAAFIVGKTGNVEWIGHPMTMDDALAQIVDGSWDSVAARDEFVNSAQTERIMNEYMKRLSQAAGSGDFPAAVKICDELVEKLPGNTDVIEIRLSLLLQGGMIKEFNQAAAEQVEARFENAMAMNQIAWMIADGTQSEERDLNLALKAALQASKLTKDGDPSILDTVARVYAEQDNLAEAIAWQKKAVAAAPGTKQLDDALAAYEAKANPAKETTPEPTETPDKPAKEPAKEPADKPADKPAKEAAEQS